MVMMIKARNVQVFTLRPSGLEADVVRSGLEKVLGANPRFLEGEPVILDLAEAGNGSLDSLIDECHSHGMRVVGVANAGALAEQANGRGLATFILPAGRQELRELPGGPEALPVPAPEAEVVPATVFLRRQVRSGQQHYVRGASLVVVGDVSEGAEVVADGSVHVYGTLRGRAVAGAGGDGSTRVLATDFRPELVSIGGTYRLFEEPCAQGGPAMALLDGSRLVVESL